MPVIPEEYLPQLASLGIVEPSKSRWKKEHSSPVSHEKSTFNCSCGPEKWGHRITLHKTNLKNRVVFIGQCDLCHAIYWRPALDDYLFYAYSDREKNEKILEERQRQERGSHGASGSSEAIH